MIHTFLSYVYELKIIHWSCFHAWNLKSCSSITMHIFHPVDGIDQFYYNQFLRHNSFIFSSWNGVTFIHGHLIYFISFAPPFLEHFSIKVHMLKPHLLIKIICIHFDQFHLLSFILHLFWKHSINFHFINWVCILLHHL